MARVLLIGEPIALLIALEMGPLKDVEHFIRKLAGAEVNVCFGLSRLEHKVTFITRLGKDPFGEYAFEMFENEGIHTGLITFDDEYLTGSILKGKVLQGDPPIAFYCKGSAASKITTDLIESIDLSEIDFIHITGVFPAISDTCFWATLRLMERAKEAKIPLSFDPNLRPTLWGNEEKMIKGINKLAALSDLVLPGIEEGFTLTGFHQPEKIADFYQALGVESVIVKLGADGAYLRDSENSQTITGFLVEDVVDTVGAGDGFATGLVSGIIEGLSLQESVMRGNAIGSIQIQHIGDNEGLPTREELFDYMKNQLKAL